MNNPPKKPQGISALWKRSTHSWALKLICLILAFAVWQGIRVSTSFEVVVADIPLLVTAGDGHAVLELSSDVVSIRFRGSREDISYISRDQITVELDISERADRLRQTVKLISRYVKTPSRAHIVGFYPTEIVVTIDREVERLLPIKATFEGSLPEGVQLEKAVCEPASVRIRGAEQRLRNLELIRTVPIHLDGRYNSFKTHVAVAVKGQPWTASPERVAVQMELVERGETRTIENVQVRALLASNNDQAVSIRPENVNVILRGSPERIENVAAKDLYAYVDCTGLTTPAEYEMPIRIDVPDGIQVEKTEPSIVKVVIKGM